MHNVYGRDFTINALIYSLYDQNLYDPTDRAKKAFDEKEITSLLPAHLLVKYNPLAILRAIRFSIQYEFIINHDLRRAIKEYKHLLFNTYTKDRILKEIVKILHIDTDKAFEALKQYKLHELISTSEINDYLRSLG